MPVKDSGVINQMSRTRSKSLAGLMEQFLAEASWLVSDAQALTDYGRKEEAGAELARAAACEDQVACLLEADGQEREAAIHRVSAASCHDSLGQYARAVTLLRAALSAVLPDDYRTRVEQQLTRCLAQARKGLKRVPTRGARKPSSALPSN
jgi:tetratricopeptide (TPR) repeat protein